MKIDSESWYELGPGDNVIWCGVCTQKALDDTASGKYTGDEAVTLDHLKLITDSDTEPYQCDECTHQNEAYEELGERD